jgi:hypothetical protein
MNIQMVRAMVCGICLLALPSLHGQQSSSTPVPEEAPTGIRRFSFGAAVAGYPFNPLHNVTESFTDTQPSVPADYSISTVNNYLRIGVGPVVEFAVSRKFSLVGQLFYHRLDYTQTTQITQGALAEGITANSRVTFWDVPAMLRFRGVREEGVLSHLYFAGGGVFRDATSIRSSTLTQFPNGTSATSTAPIRPSTPVLGGAVVGAGMRFVDDFGIKVEPELRYTRWMGRTFDAESTRSSPNQIELDLAFTF